MTFKDRLPVALVTLLLAFIGVRLAAQDASLNLDSELTARLNADTVPMQVGEGITIKEIQGRRALTLPTEGLTAQCIIARDVWSGEEGTIQFWLRTAERFGHVQSGERPFKVALVSCPAFRLELWQQWDCPWFVALPDDDAAKPRAICRISYLLPDRWYHVAITWQAETGTTDVFINGWAQQRIALDPWNNASEDPDIPLRLGVVAEPAERASLLSIADPKLCAWTMNQAQLRQTLGNQEFCDVGWGVRKQRTEPMDMSGIRTERVYQADFSGDIPVVKEDALFENGERVRVPEPGQWVLEGNAEVSSGDGTLLIDNLDLDSRNHVVLWLPQVFPEDMLLEFEFRPEVPDRGLAIVFFAARPRDDPSGSIFAPGLARRGGDFRNYIRGDLNSYHVSYVAAGQISSFIPGPRRTANIRKNSGFWLVACGDDQIYGEGYRRRWHPVRILKVGGKIRIEANGQISAAVDDDGKTWGPVWGDGYIGLRQMNHLLSGEYRNLNVYRVTEEQE